MINGPNAILPLINWLVKNKMVSMAVPILGIIVSCFLLIFGNSFGAGFVYYVVCGTGSIMMISSGVLFIVASICQVLSTINKPPRKK
jgi:hypothetical protein